MASKFVGMVPLQRRQGNYVPFAATRWPISVDRSPPWCRIKQAPALPLDDVTRVAGSAACIASRPMNDFYANAVMTVVAVALTLIAGNHLFGQAPFGQDQRSLEGNPRNDG